MYPISITVIYEGDALNRNEKLNNNTLTVKKLTYMGEEYSYISKYALRHYLFETLRQKYGWKPAEVKLVSEKGNGKQQDKNAVLQFDLAKSNILNSEELDVFGYFFSSSENFTLSRKSVVGITKAISLEPFSQDLSLYANHDLVERARKAGYPANPNPFNKEEHHTLFKATFMIDSNRIGKDTVIISKQDKKSDNGEKKEKDEIVSSLQASGYQVDDKGDLIIYKAEKSEEERKRILRELISAISLGLVAQSSGEENTLVPKFLFALQIPVPIPLTSSVSIRIDSKMVKVNLKPPLEALRSANEEEAKKLKYYYRYDPSLFEVETLEDWESARDLNELV